MSGIGFSERVRLLLQKRLDTTKWPVGDSPPGGIRYLSDGQGNLISILTTSVNPNDKEPIAPGSAESAAETDPTVDHGGILIPFSITAKVNPVFVTMTATILSTNNIMTFESPVGTDYSVPTGKTFLLNKLIFKSSLAGMTFNIGYGDDGVGAGTSDPTAPVWVIGSNNSSSALMDEVADRMYEILLYGSIPAGKFPFLDTAATSGFKNAILQGVEVDA